MCIYLKFIIEYIFINILFTPVIKIPIDGAIYRVLTKNYPIWVIFDIYM